MTETSYLYLDGCKEAEIKIKPLFNCEPPSYRTILVSLVALLGISLAISGILGRYDILSNLGTVSLGMIALGSAICVGLLIYILTEKKEVKGVEIGTTDQETGLWTWETCSNEEFLELRPFIPDGEYLKMRKGDKTLFVPNKGSEIIPEDESQFKTIVLRELRKIKASAVPKKAERDEIGQGDQSQKGAANIPNELENVPYELENQLALQRLGPNEFFWGLVCWYSHKLQHFEESICYKVDNADRFVSHGDETWDQALAFAHNPDNKRVDLQTLLTRK